VFVQVIQGQVTDAGKVRAALDRWAQELAPGATGWLGSTAGVTEDGRFIALARFESEQAARANSDRPEQDRWWAETAKLFTGEASFKDSSDVTVDVTGDPDAAGFVQVMQGRGSDPERARELMGQRSSAWAAFRPEILGSVTVGHGGGAPPWRCPSPRRRRPVRANQGAAAGAKGPDGGDGGAECRGAGVLRP